MADLDGQEASSHAVTTLQPPAPTHVRASSGPIPTLNIDSAKEDSGEDKQTSRLVTLEARKVLEQFLKRSLSQNDASPYQREQQTTELGLIEEHPDSSATGCVLRSESYHNAAVENPYYMYGPHSNQVEPDYVYAHSIIDKTASVSSQSSYGYSLKSFQGPGRSRSPSDKMTFSVRPPPIKPICKVKSSKGKKKAHFDASSSSSTSTEDYEYVDNEFLSRKKKSFFRWASERLRESFRRKKEASAAGSDLESPKDELPPGGCIKPKKKKKGKLKLSLKRSNSEKSKSSSTPNEAAAEAQAAEPKTSRKEEKEKGLWDSFLRSVRKSGLKLKRKGSKGKTKYF